MYVLIVTFYRTTMPTFAPATSDAVMSCSTTFEDVPMAVSNDLDALNEEADRIKKRFSATYYSHQIFKAKEV